MLPHLRAAADRLGVPLDDRALERFSAYRHLLLAANQQFNLTRVTDPVDVELRLFADSLALLEFLPDQTTTLLDVGSGGGVPGLAIAIARPDLDVTLLDATTKKTRFLRDTAAALGLSHVAVTQGRAEELSRAHEHRERYDVVTARAVARLVTLAELALPFLRIGGLAILPKGSAAADELAEGRYAIGMVGGNPRPLVPSPIEGTTVVLIDKRRATPAKFPRRAGAPKKEPLLRPAFHPRPRER